MNVRMEPEYLLIEGIGVISTVKDETDWADACYRTVIQHGARKALIDLSQISFETGIIDQCNVVKHYNQEYEVKIRAVRTALLVKGDDKELHDFWELYANNRGYPWKVFTDIEPAVVFLTKN